MLRGNLKEYRKFIEKDAALERRFQPVMVEEPSISDSIGILQGIRDYYEKYHRVKISDEVIRQAVLMSERYITDRFLPDKAIDVIDDRANGIPVFDCEGITGGHTVGDDDFLHIVNLNVVATRTGDHIAAAEGQHQRENDRKYFLHDYSS